MFMKPRADVRSTSAAGGAITLIAGSTAALLFVAQLYFYIVGSTRHTLHLSESLSIPMLPIHVQDPFQSRQYDIHAKIPLKLHITFPHIQCKDLDVNLNAHPITKADFDHRSGESKIGFKRPDAVELKKAGYPEKHRGGCTIRTTLRVPVVSGHVTITLTREAWGMALNHLMLRSQFSEQQLENDPQKNDFNVTHYVHSIQFGKRFHKAAAFPLEDRHHVIHNNMGGIALENVQVKLVPTVIQGWFTTTKTYQMSVTAHAVQPETMVNQGVAMTPGLALSYDVTPLAVHHDEGRDNVVVFLSSLVSIVGGVFVTVGLFTGCLVHSAKVVAKKVD
jgi:Endoplasmic reticulum vesicle transporter/Endoplasmic Reticulum-Golgi Intermediate Compartment (ERGIC)